MTLDDSLPVRSWSPSLSRLLEQAGRRPWLRLGPVSVVSDPHVIRQLLLHAELDRTGKFTTGGEIADSLQGTALFNDSGAHHRLGRSLLIGRLHQAATDRVWSPAFEAAEKTLAATGQVDGSLLAQHMAGLLAAFLLEVDQPPLVLAAAAFDVSAHAVRSSLRVVRVPKAPAVQEQYLEDLVDSAGLTSRLLSSGASRSDARAELAVVCLAAVTTTMSALPRVMLLATRTDQSGSALLASLAPTVAMPRRLAADYQIGSLRLKAGQLVILNLLSQQCRTLDPRTSLVFGTGTHACPGAAVARQMADETALWIRSNQLTALSGQAATLSAFPSWRHLRLGRLSV